MQIKLIKKETKPHQLYSQHQGKEWVSIETQQTCSKTDRDTWIDPVIDCFWISNTC